MSISLCLVTIWPSLVLGQDHIRVGLDVTDQAGGLFESGFSAGLRSLGDVVVVTLAEDYDFLLRVAAACVPDDDCDAALSYAVAIVVSQPIDLNSVSLVLTWADRNRLEGLEAQEFLDTVEEQGLVADELHKELARLGYESVHTWGALFWGREVYERSIRELIAGIDADCFENTRLRRRLVPENFDGPDEYLKTLEAIEKQLKDRHERGLSCGLIAYPWTSGND